MHAAKETQGECNLEKPNYIKFCNGKRDGLLNTIWKTELYRNSALAKETRDFNVVLKRAARERTTLQNTECHLQIAKRQAPIRFRMKSD